MRLQANSPIRTTFKFAASISRRSSSQRDSGHCSGYQATPMRIAFCPGICVGMALLDCAAGVVADASRKRANTKQDRARERAEVDTDASLSYGVTMICFPE